MEIPTEHSAVLTAQNLKALEKMNLFSDALMTTFFADDNEAAQLLLDGIIDNEQLLVTKVKTQSNLSNLKGHAARLDILARDNHGNIYNVEIQCAAKGASPRRARYYNGIIDMHNLPKGTDYDQLPDTYIIFIVEHDHFRRALPIYHFKRIMEDENIQLNDGTHIIYVNAKIVPEGKLGDIMHDFYCTNANDMRVPYFAQRMQFFKEEREGQIIMCEIIDELRKDAVYDEKIETAKRMLRKGKCSYDEIAEYADIPLEKVLELTKQQSA